MPKGVPLRRGSPLRASPGARRESPLTRERVRYKNETGTWLSPLEQPRPNEQARQPGPPRDSQHRRFVASAALHLDEIADENARHFGETLRKTFEAYPLFPGLSASSVNEDCLHRSVDNCPVKVPWEIFPETAQANVVRDKESGDPLAGSVRYAWLERGALMQDKVVHEGIYTYQVRHHSKLEPFHEMRRPVYCINLKTDYGDLLDLRVVALVNTEMPFLNAAARRFARESDFFEGLPVVDHAGRLLVDERVIRRAAYHYAEYQRSLFERLQMASDRNEVPSLRQPAASAPEHIRYAHFLVFRSHLPELSFDKKSGTYALTIPTDDEAASLLSEAGGRLSRPQRCRIRPRTHHKRRGAPNGRSRRPKRSRAWSKAPPWALRAQLSSEPIWRKDGDGKKGANAERNQPSE